MIRDPQQLRTILQNELSRVKVTDVHTHVFPADFGQMLLFGIDEVLTYHYLIAEFFRYSDMPYGEFYKLPKEKQADLIWQTLFLDRSPVSEAQRGALTVLKNLGLDVQSRSLGEYREYYRSRTMRQQIDTVFSLAGVDEVVMTNDVFDPQERAIWKSGAGKEDPRFKAALRIDPLLMDYANSHKTIQAEGYQVDASFGGDSPAEVRRFLTDWIRRMDALYMAVSLPPDFNISDNSLRTRIVKECILPVCREQDVAFALMIGVKKLVNEPLGLAGDSLGKADLGVIEELCTNYPKNKFLVTMLSRENQHELAITARKYRNLMIFGCWWFLNNPSIVMEITKMRLETLGLSFIPQHSDARVLEHLIYKWDHSKALIGQVLEEKYTDLLATGWTLSTEEIRRDVEALFRDNFHRFLGR
ncbi:MAG TPA: glucuronate isomerase [Firmicutes bacterium]|nr:glucuronate isomerase [Bacillota bacterium]